MDAKTKVLVVDDSLAVRLAMQRSLQSDTRTVSLVSDGDAALHAMEAQPYDVVMLDLRMPGIDGMSVLKTIKDRWPESEVVIVTGYPTIETAIEAVRLGAFDYLAKPIGPDQIITAANKATMRKKWALREERSSHRGDGDPIASHHHMSNQGETL